MQMAALLRAMAALFVLGLVATPAAGQDGGASVSEVPYPNATTNIAELEANCAANFSPSCYLLGMIYFRGNATVAKDISVGAAYWEKACFLGYTQSCALLGDRYLSGNGLSKDSAKAAKLFSVVCEREKLEDIAEALSCFNLGVFYDQGDGVPMDKDKAATLYAKACDNDIAPGCYNLGIMHANGEGVAKDWDQAKTYMRRALEIFPDYSAAREMLANLERGQ